jgi:hypothetical protein
LVLSDKAYKLRCGKQEFLAERAARLDDVG